MGNNVFENIMMDSYDFQEKEDEFVGIHSLSMAISKRKKQRHINYMEEEYGELISD